jgi:hypothetical protein
MKLVLLNLAVLYFGYLLTLILFKKIHLLARLAYGFLFGTAIFSIILFCFSIFHGKTTVTNVSLLLLLLIVMLKLTTFYLKIKLEKWETQIVHGFLNLDKIEKILVIIFLALIIFSILLATYWPVYEWDALALYDFRGRVIAHTGELLGTIGQTEYFSHYPPITSILHSLVYIFGGKNPQYIYPLYYISLLFVFYFRLLKSTNRKAGLFTTLILASNPVFFMHSTFAYTNLPYAIYFFVGTVYVYLFAIKKKTSYLVIAALSMGLTTWMSDILFPNPATLVSVSGEIFGEMVFGGGGY